MTIEQTQSKKLKPENHKANPRDIGLIFAREYYTFLNRKPNRLHAFYGADSLFVRGDEGEPVPMVKGQEAIRKKIEELKFDNCKVIITQVDSQVSANEGVLISVLGEITNNEQSSQKFAETFFLAPQPNGYYVLNNIFRFLKDKVDINYYQCEDEEEDNNVEKSKKENKAEQVEVKKIKEKQPEHVVDHLYEPESSNGKVVEQEKVKKQNPKKATKEVTEEPGTANKPTASIHPSVTPAPPLVVTPEVNVHYNNEMPNTYSRDQRTYQPIPNANKSWATLAASNANESTINEPSEVIKSPPSQQHYYNQYQKPELSAEHNYNPSMHVMNNIPHAVNNFNMPLPQQQQPYQQQQQQQQQSPMQYHRPPYQQQQQQQQQQQNHNKDQRIKETQIFVKNVTSSMTEEHLTAAFSQFGAIKSVSVKNQSNIAFIEFQSVTSTQKALEQRKVMIGNVFVIAEERRPPTKRTQYDNTNNNNRRFHQQQNRRGSASSTHTAGVNATPNNKRGAVTTSVGQK